MGGTLLQEFGHDQIILYFIHKVLKEKEKKDAFYIVHPATGPKRDIHFWNPEHNEFTSGCNESMRKYGVFIPEYYERMQLPKNMIQRLNRDSNYKSQEWYKKISKRLGRDLKDLTDKTCNSLEQSLLGDLPDIIGIGGNGRISLFAEVKYEGLSLKSISEIERHNNVAHRFDVPYFLIIPTKPTYARKSNTIIKQVPNEIITYEFLLQNEPIPSLRAVKFRELKR